MKHLIGLFALAALTSAQVRTIETGTTVSIRTNESIDAKKDDGRIYSGVVDQDVTDSRGNIAIPRGSSAELVVRKLEDKQLSLDLEAVTVNGQRYATAAEDSTLGDSRKDGVGTNERTAKYVGGGALLGAVVGAIAGGGKGAAIGAAAGAGAGAGAQVLTRGKSVKVPAESLLTFRLQQPLGVGAPDSGTTRNGKRYLKRRR